MEGIEERLAELVRKYPHLYNASLPYYKDAQMISPDESATKDNNVRAEVWKATVGVRLRQYVSTSSVTWPLSGGDCSLKHKCSNMSDTLFFVGDHMLSDTFQ